MTWAPGDAKRTLPRVHRQLDFELPDGWRGEVIDLSATGLRIRCLAEIALGTVIDGTLRLRAGDAIRLRGAVVWSQPADHRAYEPAEIGIELQEVPDAYLELVAQLFADQ